MPITKVTCTKGMWYKKDQQLCGLQTVYQYSINCLWQWIIGLSFKCQAWEFSGFQSISGIYIVLFWIVWQCALCSTVIWRGSRVMYVALCYIAMTSFCVILLSMHPPVHAGIARHRGFASLTHSKSQSRIVVTSAAAHGRIVKTVKKVTTYMVGTVKRQNTSSSERSWRKIAETRQSLFRKSAWSGYAHKMCAVDSNTKRLYSNEMSDRATHFTMFMIMNCPVEQQILAAYGSIVDSW